MTLRLYRDEDKMLRLDKIISGRGVYPLVPSPEDYEKPLGYYDDKFELIRTDQK